MVYIPSHGLIILKFQTIPRLAAVEFPPMWISGAKRKKLVLLRSGISRIRNSSVASIPIPRMFLENVYFGELAQYIPLVVEYSQI